MAENAIEVEYIATVAGALQAVEKINKRLDAQEQKLQKVGDTSKQTVGQSIAMLQKYEKELKDAEAALKGMSAGNSAFDNQKRKVEELRQAVARTKAQLKEQMPSNFGVVTKTIGGTAAAAWALVAALKAVGDAHDEVVSKGAATIVNLDTMARKMQIQAGLTDPEREEQSRQIVEQSSAAGVRAEVGFQAATQLAGSGFADSVNSGTLTSILDTIQASSFQGSPDQLVSAFAEAMNAYGLEKTNNNLQQIAVAAQSLFKQTDFQLTELADFAKNASVFKSANIDMSESMAAFTALREVLPAAEAGTGLRNFVNKLQAGDITKENKENLKRIGVKSEQVDFVGENLSQVLSTVKAATDKMPEEDRNAALGKMFGTENVASARLLMNSVPRIEALQKSQQDPAQFMADRNVAAGGMQADLNREENKALLKSMEIKDELHNEKMRIVKTENFFKDQREVAAAKMGPVGTALAEGVQIIGPVGIPGALGVGEAIDKGTGTQFMEKTSGGMLNVFQSLFRSQEKTNELLAKQNELLAEPKDKPPVPAPPLVVNVQIPSGRPKESTPPGGQPP